MLLTGLPITAQEACATGLVTTVVPVDQLDAEVEATCSAIKHKSRSVVALGKQFFYEQIGMDIGKAYQKGEQVCIYNSFYNILSIHYIRFQNSKRKMQLK